MLTMASSTSADFAAFGRRMWQETRDFTSHEQASQYITEQLYREFINQDGQPALALVRIFRLTDVHLLPPDVQKLVAKDEDQVMALTGTYGMETNWCDRKQSVNHQAVPLSAIAVPQRIPMFQEVMTQLGIDLESFYQTHQLTTTKGYRGQFHIPTLKESEAIPDQESFVKSYGLQSLVGFGGFITGEKADTYALYLLYAFSRDAVSAEAAANFYAMQDFIGTAVAESAARSTVFD